MKNHVLSYHNVIRRDLCIDWGRIGQHGLSGSLHLGVVSRLDRRIRLAVGNQRVHVCLPAAPSVHLYGDGCARHAGALSEHPRICIRFLGRFVVQIEPFLCATLRWRPPS